MGLGWWKRETVYKEGGGDQGLSSSWWFLLFPLALSYRHFITLKKGF